jgi:hypothetical protein
LASGIIGPSRVNWNAIRRDSSSCAILIVTAGFESRARTVFDHLLNPSLRCLAIVKYVYDIEGNHEALAHFTRRAGFLGVSGLREIPLDPAHPANFEISFVESLRSMEIGNGDVWLDISGLPMWGICSALKAIRSELPFRRVRIFYTEAEIYFPTLGEYRKSNVYRESDKLHARLPESLTSEMAKNLILESFAGVSLREHSTLLILYAGYEKHRSLGVVEEVNPTLLLIIYGSPGRKSLRWRLGMSASLHSTLVVERPAAVETVSTLSLDINMALLDQYYSMLYDDYNICVAPVCSKMQAVATYLVWERYRDIQLVFPLPVRYLDKRFTMGEGKTFSAVLPPPPGLVSLESLTGRR